MKMLCLASALVAGVSVAVENARAEDVPWVDTRIVIDESLRDATIAINAPTSATEVCFGAPATLTGATLTMLPPARISGVSGTILNPLAGSDGLTVGDMAAALHTVYFSKTPQLLWSGVRLADVVDVTRCYMCGSWGGNAKTVPDHIYFTKAEDGQSATVQLQAWQINQWTRTVLVRLDQAGEDVTGTLVWAKYSSDPASNGKDWLKDPAAANSGTHGDYNQYPNSDQAIGCGATGIEPLLSDAFSFIGAFPVGTVTNNVRNLTVLPQQDLVVSNAVTGTGLQVVFRNELGAVETYTRVNDWVGTDETLVSENATIWSVDVKSVNMVGTAVDFDTSLPKNQPHFGTWSTGSGTVRTIQAQCHANGGPGNDWTKVVTLEFRQDGSKVWMKAVNCCYAAGNRLGEHITSNVSNPCTATPRNGMYGILSITLTHRSGQHTLSFAGQQPNTMEQGARFVIDSVPDATCYNRNAFPANSTLVLTNGTQLILRPGSDGFFGTGGTKFVIDVHEGCTIANALDWGLGPYARLNLIGGRYVGYNVIYHNFLTLSNGASVEGSASMRVGYYEGNSVWRTLPGDPCTVSLCVCGARREHPQLYRNVHEFAVDADLHLTKPLFDLGSTTLFGLTWKKSGAATLHLEADASNATHSDGTVTVGAFEISAGTLACDANSVLSGKNPMTLSGGAIGAGSYTNAFGTLAVTADSAITLKEGAVVTFADSSALDWSGTLAVTGPWERLGTGCVRFGTTDAGLTRPQLRKITYNGKAHAYLDEEGWLMNEPRGLVIIVE